MENKQKISTKKIAVTAMMAALTIVGSAVRITIPIDIGGNTSFHLGNIMCALSGILLGPWLGGLAAGLGSFLYDMTNPAYIDEAWLTSPSDFAIDTDRHHIYVLDRLQFRILQYDYTTGRYLTSI